MWKSLFLGCSIVVVVAELSSATVIIDDFTVGPALSTFPPYSDSTDPGLEITQDRLDPRHTWAGFRGIGAGTFPKQRDNPPPFHAILATSSDDNGRMVYLADIGTEALGFLYTASGTTDTSDPLLAAPLDFSTPNAALVIDVLYSSGMGGRMWFTGKDIHGRRFGKEVSFPESVEPFSLSLTLEPSDEFDRALISQFWLELSPSKGSLSVDNIKFVPEPGPCTSLLLVVFFSFARHRRRS